LAKSKVLTGKCIPKKKPGCARRWISPMRFDPGEINHYLAGRRLLDVAKKPASLANEPASLNGRPMASDSECKEAEGSSPTRGRQGGRPRSMETARIYRLCYQLRKKYSDPVVMRKVNTKLGREAIKDVKYVWIYAKRHENRMTSRA